MRHVNIADAKAHLSEYLREVKKGETLIICERNVPVAEVRPIEIATGATPRFGTLRDEVWIADDAFAPMSEGELQEWERPVTNSSANTTSRPSGKPSS